MSFFKLSKICLVVSALLVLGSLFLLVKPGPELSIEFTGGTLMEVRLPADKTKENLMQSVGTFKDPQGNALTNVTTSVIQGVAGTTHLMRMASIDNDTHVALLAHLTKDLPGLQEIQFTTIGPSVSASLKQKSLVALAIASLAIIVYLAFSFRKLPKQLSPWKFGALAVLAFVHDIAITTGIFVIISKYTSFEMDTLFVTALLSILAFSVNDTIVIFDRIRSTLLADRREDLEPAVVHGLRDCITRTMHTTIAGLIMLFSLFFLGSESIKWFILTLIVGTIIGTYSSYFVAAPLLVIWSRKKK